MERMVFLVLVLVAGCETERVCDSTVAEAGGSYCRGNTLYTCESLDIDDVITHSWQRTPCLSEGKVCVAVDDRAFCAVRDETCPEGIEPGRSFCLENSVAECQDGHVTSMIACEDDTECIDSVFESDNPEPYFGAVCSMSSEPCPENTASYCSGNAVIECLYGYPHEVERQCEDDGEECREMVIHGLWFDREVHARCVDTEQTCPPNTLGYCIGEDEYQRCWAGFQFGGPHPCLGDICVEFVDEVGNRDQRCDFDPP